MDVFDVETFKLPIETIGCRNFIIENRHYTNPYISFNKTIETKLLKLEHSPNANNKYQMLPNQASFIERKNAARTINGGFKSRLLGKKTIRKLKIVEYLAREYAPNYILNTGMIKSKTDLKEFVESIENENKTFDTEDLINIFFNQ